MLYLCRYQYVHTMLVINISTYLILLIVSILFILQHSEPVVWFRTKAIGIKTSIFLVTLCSTMPNCLHVQKIQLTCHRHVGPTRHFANIGLSGRQKLATCLCRHVADIADMSSQRRHVGNLGGQPTRHDTPTFPTKSIWRNPKPNTQIPNELHFFIIFC